MTDSPLDVVVVGNAGVDTNVYLIGADIDFDVESNFTENIDYVGQAGGYTSRGYAQLGKRTAFIGYVGDDHNGRLVRRELAGDGIDLGGLFIDPAGTARSVNLMYQDGRRKNFYDGKDHMNLRPDMDRCRAILSRAKLAHFSLPNWARYLLPVAREEGLTIACDIQDVLSADDPYRQAFIDAADILFFSEANVADLAALIEHYLDTNPRQIVVVGRGAKGCALANLDNGQIHIREFPAVAMEAPVIDTNGAGDGLAVGFLTSYVLEGRPLGESVCRGQIAARYTCALRASSSNLISAGQLDAFYRQIPKEEGSLND
jgi:sugar/nucleoside kinase (ribokinase family)